MITTKHNKVFTLIELLVVIIIIGILSAIALPSFLNQVSKARASEAKTNISAVLKAQQAYYLENSEFAKNFNQLKAGIDKQTPNYKYDLVELPTIGSSQASGILGYPKKEDLTAHLGVIEANINENNNIKTVICEAEQPGLNEFSDSTLSEVRTGALKCSKSGKRVGR